MASKRRPKTTKRPPDDPLALASRLLDLYDQSRHDYARGQELAQQLRLSAVALPDDLSPEFAARFFGVWVRSKWLGPQGIRAAHFPHLLAATQYVTSPRDCYVYGVPWTGRAVPLEGVDTSPAAFDAAVQRAWRRFTLNNLPPNTPDTVARVADFASDHAFVEYCGQDLRESTYVVRDYEFNTLLLLVLAGTQASTQHLSDLFHRILGHAEPAFLFPIPEDAFALLGTLDSVLTHAGTRELRELRAQIQQFLAAPTTDFRPPSPAPLNIATYEQTEVEKPDDDLFWDLVRLANADWVRFTAMLREQPTPIVAGFGFLFFTLASVFWEWAGTEVGCSEDAAEDHGGRVVARGKEFFIRAIQQPGTIDKRVLESLDGRGMEIQYEAQTVFFERTGKELPVSEGWYFELDDTEYGALVNEALK